MNNVMCVKWGDLYGPEYVNILYAMVKRNLTTPFRFICFTEDATGIRDEVEVKPLPKKKLEGWWTKLAFFQNLPDVEGPCLTLDLDMVVVDNIDCFFEYEPDDFCMKWDYSTKGKKEYANSSCVMKFNANNYSHIYNNLDLKTMDYVVHHSVATGIKRHKYWGDQIWISEQMEGHVKLWPKPWIPKFGKDCHRNPQTKQPYSDHRGFAKLDLKTLEFFLPDGAKILAFSGRKQRNENELNKIGKWWHPDA